MNHEWCSRQLGFGHATTNGPGDSYFDSFDQKGEIEPSLEDASLLVPGIDREQALRFEVHRATLDEAFHPPPARKTPNATEGFTFRIDLYFFRFPRLGPWTAAPSKKGALGVTSVSAENVR